MQTGSATKIIGEEQVGEGRTSGSRELVPTTKPIEALIEQLGPEVIFGKPVQTGATMIIPVAEVRTGFGFGAGRGPNPRGVSAEGEAERGGGVGGGAGARIVPRGYIRATGDDVRFEGVVDLTRVALAGFAFGAWVAFLVSKILRF